MRLRSVYLWYGSGVNERTRYMYKVPFTSNLGSPFFLFSFVSYDMEATGKLS